MSKSTMTRKNTTNRKYTESEIHELSNLSVITSLYSIPVNQAHSPNIENTIML
ncbi:hypothetical protein [Clostridium sp.]|uniref:hypothetical protein n=1 Tax=Clostridium sp. TaxID=1506 RepID=UPI003217423A